MVTGHISQRLRLGALALASALFGSFVTGTTLVLAEDQPNMVAARQSLQQAISYLNKGLTDKGGHRVNAIKLAQQAINEIDRGIAYANAHHH